MEIDIEGVARDGDYLYAAGSHSLVRKTLRDNDAHSDNRDKIAKVEPPSGQSNVRDSVFRLTFDSTTGGMNGKPEQIDIKDFIRQDPVLARFADIPSKENGIDIEGITVFDGTVYLGFRGPVLRGNFVPIMVFNFDKPAEYQLRFVNLKGLGVRDLNRVGDGFLLMAGPVGDGPGSFRFYHWNGLDCLPGTQGDGGRIRGVGKIPTDPMAKAEGFAVTREGKKSYEIIVVYDGVKGGGPRSFKIKKR